MVDLDVLEEVVEGPEMARTHPARHFALGDRCGAGEIRRLARSSFLFIQSVDRCGLWVRLRVGNKDGIAFGSKPFGGCPQSQRLRRTASVALILDFIEELITELVGHFMLSAGRR